MKTERALSKSILALLCTLATASANIAIETVPIGNPGNPNDQNYGLGARGAVAYAYAIGTYEVTLTQYAAFLNAVAQTDTYGLYNSLLGSDPLIKGITRSNSPGSYSYAAFGNGQRPVTYVTWFNAARFANWLHNGQPTGLQTAATTEAGAYALNGAISGNSFTRSAGAQFWLPSQDEWYKAAFYQPAVVGGDSDGYWLYPMKTNSVPYSDAPPGATPDNARAANFRKDDGVANGYNDGYALSGTNTLPTTTNVLTPAGAYTASQSYYGTFDQGGNVTEWTDSKYLSTGRYTWGGGWDTSDVSTAASSAGVGFAPTDKSFGIGFRIATVPEPTVSISLILAGGLLLARRKRPSVL